MTNAATGKAACCRYARLDFTWDQAGLVNVATRFVAIPDITLTMRGSTIDRTILAAFVLLVLLTATQAGLIAWSIFHEMTGSNSLWTAVQVRRMFMHTVNEAGVYENMITAPALMDTVCKLQLSALLPASCTCVGHCMCTDLLVICAQTLCIITTSVPDSWVRLVCNSCLIQARKEFPLYGFSS